MRLAIFAFSLLVLSACTPPPQAPQPHGDVAAPQAPSAGPAFTVNVTFSAKAAAKLAGMNEKVIVSAMFYGEPRPGFEPKEAGDVGVNLGNIDNTIAPANGATIFAPAFDAAKLAKEVKGEPRVLINIYSARQADDNNLLDCGIYDDLVSAAAKTAPTIACKLIVE